MYSSFSSSSSSSSFSSIKDICKHTMDANVLQENVSVLMLFCLFCSETLAPCYIDFISRHKKGRDGYIRTPSSFFGIQNPRKRKRNLLLHQILRASSKGQASE